MKRAKKFATILASAFISVCFLVGCGEKVSVNSGLIVDNDVAPTQTAEYEQYTRQALDEYFAVADKHRVDGDVDVDNEEVIAAAKPTAAKLFAYACYNERRLNQYVFFSHQKGNTDLGINGSATAIKQEYYLRINEQEGITCGYRYHYTIKKVAESSGSIGMFKDLFESARTRITDETDLLYRLEGSKIKDLEECQYSDLIGDKMLACDWKTGKDWGKHDLIIRKGDFIEPDKIEEDIVNYAEDDNHTIRANINILAENIVENSIIVELVNENGEQEGYLIQMTIATDVANKDEASLAMLRKANGSDDCEWVNAIDEDGEETPGLAIFFSIWNNGLFRHYTVSEVWKGKISGFSGTADSSTTYFYSYSDRDCDMTPYLKMLEEAKAAKGE